MDGPDAAKRVPATVHDIGTARVVDEADCTHRPLSSSFLGLPHRVLNMNHKKELLRGLWVMVVQPMGPPPPSSLGPDSFGDGTLLISPITNRCCKLPGAARASVKRVLPLDFCILRSFMELGPKRPSLLWFWGPW